MPLTQDQQAALDQWAGLARERAAIEEFLDWITETGQGALRLNMMSRADLLDSFYSIDRNLLESARRAILTDARKGGA